MKLVYAIVSDEDSPRLMSELNRANFRVTKLNSTGGFLRSGNTTLMCVTHEENLEELLALIRKNSKSRKEAVNANIDPAGMSGGFLPYPVEVSVGGATIFVVNVEHFEKV